MIRLQQCPSVSRASANQIDSAVVPFRPTEDRKGNRRTIYCLFLLLKPSKASRAPHRSLFEGKWRKMSKKWERREGARAALLPLPREKRIIGYGRTHISCLASARGGDGVYWPFLLSGAAGRKEGEITGDDRGGATSPGHAAFQQAKKERRHRRRARVTHFHHRVTDVDLERINQKLSLSPSALLSPPPPRHSRSRHSGDARNAIAVDGRGRSLLTAQKRPKVSRKYYPEKTSTRLRPSRGRIRGNRAIFPAEFLL